MLRAVVSCQEYEDFMEKCDSATASKAFHFKGLIANTNSPFFTDVKWAYDVLMPFVSGMKELEADTAKLSDGYFLVLGLSEHVTKIIEKYGSFTYLMEDEHTPSSTLILANSFTTTFQATWQERSNAVMTDAVVATAILDPRCDLVTDAPAMF